MYMMPMMVLPYAMFRAWTEMMMKMFAAPEKPADTVTHVRDPIAQHGGSSVAEAAFIPLSGNEPPVPSFPKEKGKKINL